MKYSVKDLSEKLQTVPSFSFVPSEKNYDCIISGTTGNLGARLCRRFTDKKILALFRSKPSFFQDNVTWQSFDDFFQAPAYAKTIIHSAANMSLANPLEKSWADNVLLTKKMLEVAATTHAHFCFISTLSVFATSDFNGHVREDEDLWNAQNLYGGYAASKWCAEYMINHSQVPHSIARLGLLVGKDLGHDPLASISTAWQKYGAPLFANPTAEEKTDLTPIEYAVNGIAQTCNNEGVFHFAGKNLWSGCELFEDYCSVWGGERGCWPSQEKTALRALLRWYDPKRAQRMWWLDVFQSSNNTYDTIRSEKFIDRPKWSDTERKSLLILHEIK